MSAGVRSGVPGLGVLCHAVQVSVGRMPRHDI